MRSASDILIARRDYSRERLVTIREYISRIGELSSLPDLCIYATGSYAREEAWVHSDLDVFFVHRGTKKNDQVSKLHKTVVDSELIRMTRDLGLPAFSRDGVFLEVHYLDDIISSLGGPDDDHQNYFTGRLLMLLESKPLFNESLYEDVIRNIINAYYRDYHKHELEFKPVFLVNDIQRFWYTLCLNYENARNLPADREEQTMKNTVRNLKLKFSRRLTCFSGFLYLSVHKESYPSEDVLGMVHMNPMERLDALSSVHQDAKSLLVDIKSQYAQFLDITNKPEEELVSWISDRSNRNMAFEAARDFRRHLYAFLRLVVMDDQSLSFLIM